MKSDPSDALDDEFAMMLAAGDEAMAAGVPREELAAMPAGFLPRLGRDLAWCQLVRELLPRAGPASSTQIDARPNAVGEPPAAECPATLGRFIIHRELGRGSFGVVFLATDPRLGREVALKVPRAEVLITPELRGRFRNEARAAASLDHPHVVPVYEAGEEHGVCFIASAYCPGITLAAWLRRRTQPVPYHLAARLVATLARAVDHAHRRGVLHRDLKPSNVILEDRAASDEVATGELGFVPRVTDFGLAKLLEAVPGSQMDGYQTHSGAIMGTPNYMAPEQAGGQSKAVGPAADLYALGAILYELLTDRPPVQADTPLDAMLLLRTQEPLSPSRLRPRLPRDLETICLKCLEKEPSRRYRTAQELAEELDRYVAGESIHARPTPAWERGLKWARRRPTLAAMAGVSIAAVVTVVAVILVANARLQKQIRFTEERRLEAQRHFEDAQVQRQQAMANLRKALDAVDRMVVEVGQVRISGTPFGFTVQRQLFQEAIQYYEDFARQMGNDPDLHLKTGRARRFLGASLARLGEQVGAERTLRTGIAELSQVANDYPDRSDYRHELASCQYELGRLLWERGRLDEAIQVGDKARQLEEVIIAADPGHAESRRILVHACNLLGEAFHYKRDAPQSENAWRRGLAVLDASPRETPPDAAALRLRAIIRNNLGELSAQGQRYVEAERLFLENQAYWQDLSARTPTDTDPRSKLALTWRNLGRVYLRTGRFNDAELAFRRAADLRLKLATVDLVDEPHQRNQLGEALRQLAILSARRGERLEACRLLDQAIRHHQLTLRAAPTMPEFLRALGADWMALADLRPQLVQHGEDQRALREFPGLFSSSEADKVAVASILARCVPLLALEPEYSALECKQLEERYATQAVHGLDEAVRQGFKDLDWLRKDPAFDAVRRREDFSAMLATQLPR